MNHRPPNSLRERCLKCRFALPQCYCRHIRAFDPGLKFMILIQWREARKHIATGRLSHLCLKDSELLRGYDYSDEERVNAVLNDPAYFPLVLYPGPGSTNLSRLSPAERSALLPAGRKPAIFVIDGTWTTARKTMQKSANLQKLPQFCFDPPHLSRIRLRKQPKPYCFSTAEAIHQVIELLGTGGIGEDGECGGTVVPDRKHDHLLEIFHHMVEQQVQLLKSQPRYQELAAAGKLPQLG